MWSPNECAARGATLLDKKRPGWADKINIEALDMQHCHSCILGHIFNIPNTLGPDFCGALESLGLNIYSTADADYGFDIHGDNRTLVNFAKLADAWALEIVERRGVKTPVVAELATCS